jgi:hypothetical protein
MMLGWMRLQMSKSLTLWITFFLMLFITTGVLAENSRIVSGPLVVSSNWPECSDLVTWTRDVMRLERLENATETAQAKAFFRWLRLFSKMATGGMLQAYEGEYGKEQYVLDVHKNLFVYGWGYCDTHSRIAEAAWCEYKKDRKSAERVVVQHADGGYHTMYRLRLDGRYAAFDARYGYYLIERDAPDARILDWAEVGDDHNLLKNKEYNHRSGPFFEYFGREWDRALLLQPVYYDSEDAWIKAGSPAECVFGNGQYQMGTHCHDMAFQLPKGTTIERYWDNTARKFYVPAGFESKGEEPFRPSGRFYRVTTTMLDGNWVKNDPNYLKCAPYTTLVPSDEGYTAEVSGGRTIGQAWGRLIYEPELHNPQFLQTAPVNTDLEHFTAAPFLRPVRESSGGNAVFDLYCPYVLVDGVVSGEWQASPEDLPTIEIRTLRPKPLSETEPDVWSSWQVLKTGSGSFCCALGHTRFNGRDVSIHGVYHFQIRLSLQPNASRIKPAGIKSLRLEAYFENGIMSIPRIVDGANTVHIKVKDSSVITAPVKVVYRYQTPSGERAHTEILQPGDFQNNVATFGFDAPGLTRCNSLVIAY